VIRVTHVITGLGAGGAEGMLVRLISGLGDGAVENQVISLTDMGPAGHRLEAAGVPVRALRMRRGAPNPFHLVRLARLLAGWRPHVVQTWMYHSDLAGGLAARLAGRSAVVWNLRHSRPDPSLDRRRTVWTARVCGRLSSWLPARVVCCSEAARREHTLMGYREHKLVVIPNGFDTETFRPDPAARRQVRAELGLGPETPLIGGVARFHPVKNHLGWIETARRIATRRGDAHFVLCGEGVDWNNGELAAWAGAAGLLRRVHLLGRRDDMPRVTAALDLAVCSSLSEGFPNAIGEAMACAVPCVASDAGDSARLVGETGRIAPVGNLESLASHSLALLALSPGERMSLGLAARRRIQQEFSMTHSVARYRALYEELTADVRNCRFH